MAAQYLYLTTTGWKSSNPHEIEIWYVEHGGCYYLVSEMLERSHWVQNIRHNPAVQVRVGERHFAGTGRILNPDAEPELCESVCALMDTKYNWSEGLIVELCPQD
ncbi:MAG: nitroreductase family deazaflavin-dependent oxidoreductase [Anaerolineales bacterium]|nr:nitroreductase family deazaflavin-dependent oxidoreductase [Anaerolineales bacterium]